jgi:choice-of-anchor C domain-containing protein
MTVSIRPAGIAVAVMVVCLCSAALAQALIKNRSFEGGADPGDAAVLAPGSKALENWTVVDGEVSYVGRKWQHAEGARSVALPCGGGITQTIETEPDQTYEVRFNMAGDPDAMPSLKTVIVSLGAETRIFTFDTAGKSRTDMGWASRTHVFKASAKASTLAFRSPKDKCSAPAVDNVRVDPIAICVENSAAAGGCVNAH